MKQPNGMPHTIDEHKKDDAIDLASNGKAALIASIQFDAQAEEAKILQEAAEQVSQRELYTTKKIELMLDEARQKAAKQVEINHNKTLLQAELEIKRRRLRASNEIVFQIMSNVEQKLKLMIGMDAYREILIGWIEEASLGLDVDAAKLNASAEERVIIDESLINEVQARVQRKRGKARTIQLDDGPALLSQGIILTSENGRIAYNNQVKTRLLRQQREIQRLIHDGLFIKD